MSSSLLHTIERAFRLLPPPASPRSLLVAFSGGLDSVVLLDGLARLHKQGSLLAQRQEVEDWPPAAANEDRRVGKGRQPVPIMQRAMDNGGHADALPTLHVVSCASRQQSLVAGSIADVTMLSAVHVHHGLSPNADDWLAFCERFCKARTIPFSYRRLTLPQTPQTSLEETARRMRHAALREMAREAGADTIVLAHHQDDQAETLLLQLLRGAGPHGLAAMAAWQPSGIGSGETASTLTLSTRRQEVDDWPPAAPNGGRRVGKGHESVPTVRRAMNIGGHADALPTLHVAASHASQSQSIVAGSITPALWRPLLDVPRTALLAYAQAHELEWVEDESNAEIGFKRNFLRHRILPALEEGFPGYRKTLSRAAVLQAEAVAALEGAYCEIDETKARFPMDQAWLAALPEAPARHALRTAFRQAGLRAPSFARLSEMLRQLQHARPDAQIELRHGTQRLGIHRGQIMLYAPVPPYRILWRGEDTVTLPHGTLHLHPGKERDLLHEALSQGKEILIASRLYEREYLKPAVNRPRRPLRDWLREAGVPHWARDTWPRIYCDGELISAANIDSLCFKFFDIEKTNRTSKKQGFVV